MTQAMAHILEEVGQLSLLERAELTDCLVESLVREVPANIAAAQISEVRKRVSQVESGEISLIPGGEALAQIRQLLASTQASN